MWPKKEDSQASKNSLRALDLADAKKILWIQKAQNIQQKRGILQKKSTVKSLSFLWLWKEFLWGSRP